MSDDTHISAVVRRRNAFEEANIAARMQIEAERTARNEKTARLRKLREEAMKAQGS